MIGTVQSKIQTPSGDRLIRQIPRYWRCVDGGSGKHDFRISLEDTAAGGRDEIPWTSNVWKIQLKK